MLIRLPIDIYKAFIYIYASSVSLGGAVGSSVAGVVNMEANPAPQSLSAKFEGYAADFYCFVCIS